MSDIIDLSSNEEVISIDSEYAYDLDNDVDENSELLGGSRQLSHPVLSPTVCAGRMY